jgi:predicted ATP-binding protein involved in virulence
MHNIFITKIHINKLRHLENVTIDLHPTERRPLLLTGKNGCGKTSVLMELDKCLMNAKSQSFELQRIKLEDAIDKLPNLKISRFQKTQMDVDSLRRSFQNIITGYQSFMNIDIYINNDDKWVENIKNNELLLKTFEARQKISIDKSEGLKTLDIDAKQLSNTKFEANKVFIQYIVNLKVKSLYALSKNDSVKMAAIDAWFTRFETMLKNIFDDNSLSLEFDIDNNNFLIKTKNHEPFDFNTLSDGYAALLNIVTEIIMRMEGKNVLAYDLEGIVLIDELETHLHIDLQKKVLPFLMEFFPKIQFIITTHSPFVLSSVKNAIVYDLEKQLRVEDMSGYSVEAIIEGYYDNDKYSNEIKRQLNDYETLLKQADWSEDDLDKIAEMRHYFNNLPKFFAPELEMQVQILDRLRRERFSVKP